MTVFKALGVHDASPVHGGCIHRCYRATLDGEAVFVKTNRAALADVLAAEADGLEALAAAGCRVPHARSHGVAGDSSYLVMQHLELRPSGDYAALGRMLARLHRASAERFGWRRDNYIGSTPQPNGWKERWRDFWRERRLAPQLALARSKGFAVDPRDVDRILEGHDPAPSLLHGDLWGGNAAFLAGGSPVIFDPAVYYGDREADLAMTELFGGFPREFYSAYESEWPLDAGYDQRKHLYNFYHLLNHLNLFGRGYLAQVEATLRVLRRG